MDRKKGQKSQRRKGKKTGNPFIHRYEVVARKVGTEDGVNICVDLKDHRLYFAIRLVGTPLRVQVVSAYVIKGDETYEEVEQAELSRRFDEAYTALGLTIPIREEAPA